LQNFDHVMDQSCSANGPLTDTTTGTILGGSRFQERTRSTKS